MAKNKTKKRQILTASFLFILLMAFVSMFSDMTHEGANSMNGAFESLLGAPDIVIAAVGGVAALLGSSLRMLSGYLADKTKHYWSFTIVGYAIDLIAVPLLAIVPENGWVLAIAFILLEKVGKAIKKPSKDTIVSFAATQNGVGKSFALGELLDQIGATLGPLILTVTYLVRSDVTDSGDKMRLGFAVLGFPALICMGLLIWAFFKFPHPESFEREKEETKNDALIVKTPLVLFLVASSLLAVGFLNSFSLINAKIYTSQIVSSDLLPLLYSYAMFIDAISAVVFGLLFDKIGFSSIAIATLFTAGYSFFIFLTSSLWAAFVGLTLWGIGMGAEESVMKSGITILSRKSERGRAFGTYELFYGIFSFLGSLLIGWLYDASSIALCLVSSLFIVAASVVYYFSGRVLKKQQLVAVH